MESGFYYVYAKTCLRYYNLGTEDNSQARVSPVDLSNIQLIQYVYHESIKQNSKAALLLKTGSTMRVNSTSYNMYCAQQGRGVPLEEGDALYVNVSNAWMLDLQGEGTYFGAIKLGNWNLNTWGADMLLNIWYAKEPLLVIYNFVKKVCFLLYMCFFTSLFTK